MSDEIKDIIDAYKSGAINWQVAYHEMHRILEDSDVCDLLAEAEENRPLDQQP